MKTFHRLAGLFIAMMLGIMSLTFCAAGEQTEWDCTECGRTGNTGNYCGGCGHPAPWLGSGTDNTASGASWKTVLDVDFNNDGIVYTWQMHEGNAEFYIENGMLVINVLNPDSDPWSTQIYRKDFQLIQGAEYELSWDMKSSTDRDVEVCIQHGESDWHVYYEQTFPATNTMKHYVLQFMMTEATDTLPQLTFNLGKMDTMTGTAAMKQHQVYIGNIQLKVLE